MKNSKMTKGFALICAAMILTLKASTFQTHCMEPENIAINDQEITITNFDELLNKAPEKSTEEMLAELREKITERYVSNTNTVITTAFSGIDGLTLTDAQLNQCKTMYNELFDRCYTTLPSDQLKIIYVYTFSPFLKNLIDTQRQIRLNLTNYINYGISQQDKICDDEVPSKFVSTFQKGYHDSILVMLNSKHLHSEEQKNNVIQHCFYKMYSELKEKHPKALTIADDFWKKHEDMWLKIAGQEIQTTVNNKFLHLIREMIEAKMKSDIEQKRTSFGNIITKIDEAYNTKAKELAELEKNDSTSEQIPILKKVLSDYASQKTKLQLMGAKLISALENMHKAALDRLDKTDLERGQ